LSKLLTLLAADLILRNGQIWTGAKIVDSVAITGNKITASTAVGPQTRVIDLKGRFAMPGINDAHIHFLNGSIGLTQVDLTGVCTLEAMQKRVADFARNHPDEPWITGRGWEYFCFPNARLPRKEDLDAVVRDRPVYLKAYDGHTGWANSMALRMSEVLKDTRFPGYGEIVRDPDGEPTGALKEGAMGLVARHVPQMTRPKKLAALSRGLELAASLGITSMQDAGGEAEEVSLYAEMPHSVRMSVAMTSFEAKPADIARWSALRAKHSTEWLKVKAVKFMIDGVIESKTAAMIEPYNDGTKDAGSPAWKEAEFKAAIARVHRAGFQIYTHAIGDRGVRLTLDAYEAAGRARHRIEHIETINPADLARFAKLNVIASMQPIHAEPGGVDVWSKLIGPTRLPFSFPWRSMEKAGARLAFSSDWPACLTVDPWRGIHTAVNRGWTLDQRVSVETALKAYTSGAAYASFEEQIKGTLEPGKLADLVVLSQNLFEIDSAKIQDTKVLLTIVDGKQVYASGDFAASAAIMRPAVDAMPIVPPKPIDSTADEGTITMEPFSLIASYSMFIARKLNATGLF
jgi:predicted amidohydrolase YtcJ